MNNFHDTLSPKIWTADKKLKPEVAKKLKEIAEAFIDFLDVPRNAIKDIVVTGSMASYNYTPQSDIDLHLLVDFDKVHKDCPIVGDFLISKKSEFNSNHDIFIYGIPVEVYAESIDNDNVHNGLYSLTTNSWIDEPKKLKPLDNDVAVKAKYKEFVEAAKNVKDGEVADKLIQKIKRMRKSGLAKEGEFSVENLVFKKLRNDGTIGKLMDIKKEDIDKELSLGEALNILEQAINEASVGSLATAASNNLTKRKEALEAKKKAFEFVKNNTSSNVKDYLKPDRALTKKGSKRKKIDLNKDIDYEAYERAQANLNSANKEVEKAENKVKRAEKISNLNLPKNSKVQANKLFGAARSSHSERFDKNMADSKKSDKSNAKRSLERLQRASELVYADPNYERRGKKEQEAKGALRAVEDEFRRKDIEDNKKKAASKEPYTNYGDNEYLEDMFKRTAPQTKQAEEDHNNAQINQGVKNKKSLGEAYEDIINKVNILLEKWGNNSGRYTNGTLGINDDSEDKAYISNSERAASYKDREMSPDKYIRACARMFSRGKKNSGSFINRVEGSRAKDRKKIDKLKNKIQSDTEQIDIPYIDYRLRQQEGLHRAVAAKELGMKKIPVRVFHSTEKDGNKGGNKQFKKKVNSEMDEALEIYESAIVKLEEMINTAITAMAPYPNTVVGQTNPSKYQKQNKGTTKKAMLNYKYQKNRTSSMTPVVETLEEIFSVCEELRNRL